MVSYANRAKAWFSALVAGIVLGIRCHYRLCHCDYHYRSYRVGMLYSHAAGDVVALLVYFELMELMARLVWLRLAVPVALF